MKVLIPAPRSRNSFFDELTSISSHEFYNKDLNEDISKYDVILIHWPEQLFGWQEPTINELRFVKKRLQSWRSRIKIVYMIHNLKPHNKAGKYYKELYDLVISNCHSMIHLGNYSKERFSKKYPDKSHTVIYHPLYRKSFTKFNKREARQKLGLSQDAIIIIAPGSIRTLNERQLITRSFKKIKSNKKELIVTRMFRKELKMEFKGRNRLKRILDLKTIFENIYNLNLNKRKHYFYDFINNTELSMFMSASDIVFIPRMNSLNSGIVFLGLTFDKIIVGPRTGNLTEIFDEFEFPSFDPLKKNSPHEALSSAVKYCELNSAKINRNKLKYFEPKHLVQKMDKYLIDIVCNTSN